MLWLVLVSSLLGASGTASRSGLSAVLARGLLLAGRVGGAFGRVLARGSLVGSRLVRVVSCVASHFCSCCLLLEAG
jgi:hypothetical protein